MEDRIEGSQTAYSHHSGCCDAGLSSAGFPSLGTFASWLSSLVKERVLGRLASGICARGWGMIRLWQAQVLGFPGFDQGWALVVLKGRLLPPKCGLT